MTREEQYQKVASKEEMDKFKDSDFDYATDSDYFILGAEWADSNPNWHKTKINDNQYDLPDKTGRYNVVFRKYSDEVMEGKFLHNSNCWFIQNRSVENDEIIAWIELPQLPKFD